MWVEWRLSRSLFTKTWRACTTRRWRNRGTSGDAMHTRGLLATSHGSSRLFASGCSTTTLPLNWKRRKIAMAEPNRRDPKHSRGNQGGRYSATGHPSVEQLVSEQGTGPIADISMLEGDFWPEEEPIEEFLATLHEWRRHIRTDPAA